MYYIYIYIKTQCECMNLIPFGPLFRQVLKVIVNKCISYMMINKPCIAQEEIMTQCNLYNVHKRRLTVRKYETTCCFIGIALNIYKMPTN